MWNTLHKCNVFHYYLLSFFSSFPSPLFSSTCHTVKYLLCTYLYVYIILLYLYLAYLPHMRENMWLLAYLAIVRQMLCHLNHIPSSLRFNYFLDRLLHFCPRPALDQSPHTYTFYILDYRSMSPWLVCWLRCDFTNFMLRLSSSHDVLISFSQAAEIIVMSYYDWWNFSGILKHCSIS
jgi:hypothetical protein